MAVPTPQKLSSLSTSTLTAVLELTRSNQQHLAPPPTLVPKINKNLAVLHSGIAQLQGLKGPEAPSKDLIASLRQQYSRLTSLVDGLGVEARSLDEGQLIEHDQQPASPYHQDQDDNRAISPSSSPLIPQHSSIAMPDEPSYDEEEARHDQESMRRANSEVQFMQQQQQQMDDQDETLDQLSLAISRQRDLSMNISTELHEHNRMLEETDDALDSTQNRLQRAAGKLERVGRKTAQESSATCIIIVLIIILLFLVILLK